MPPGHRQRLTKAPPRRRQWQVWSYGTTIFSWLLKKRRSTARVRDGVRTWDGARGTRCTPLSGAPRDGFILASEPPRGQRADSNLVVTRHNGGMGQTVPPLAALVERIDRDGLVETMLGMFREEIPGYARVPDAVIRRPGPEVVRQNIDLCLDWVAGAGAPEARAFRGLHHLRTEPRGRGYAARRPLARLPHRRHDGVACPRREAKADEHDALTRAAELVMSYVDQVSGTVTAAYMEQRHHLVSEQERGLRACSIRCWEARSLIRVTTRQPRSWLPAGRPVRDVRSGDPGWRCAGSRARRRRAASSRCTGADRGRPNRRALVAWPRLRRPRCRPARSRSSTAEVAREELARERRPTSGSPWTSVAAGPNGRRAAANLTLDLLLARAPRVAADLRAPHPRSARSRARRRARRSACKPSRPTSRCIAIGGRPPSACTSTRTRSTTVCGARGS